MNTTTIAIQFWPRRAARRGDPSTSHEAAARAITMVERHHNVIVAALEQNGPMGKDGIAQTTGLSSVAVGRRLGEMEKAGQIETTGRHVQSLSGRAEREWRVKA